MRHLAFLFLSFIWLGLQQAGANTGPDASGAPPAPDSYPLSVRDLVNFSVLNEPETSTEQRIDGQGRIRIPYLGTVRIAGLTIRQAEAAIEKAYVDNEIYITPQVTVRVVDYATREVSVLGEVNRPGNIPFPIEAQGLDIREVISQAGGFTNIAKSREVIVTRQAGGRKTTFKVNVDEMLSKSRNSQAPVFLVRAGDVIYVPERFF